MKRNIISFIGLLIIILPLRATNDTIIIKSDTELIERQLDSLTHTWLLSRSAGLNTMLYENSEPIVEFTDSVYMQRLHDIHSLISLPYNKIVRNHIHVYTGKKRDKFEIMLGLREYYFPMIEDIFDSYGLPVELKYMAVIESALNPNAVSRVGATGMWQFMYSTGRAYGLKINSIIDERRDPVKATHAAARYLKDLYRIYEDWGLVIAAYNCGPGNVNKAIRRSGNRKDYWEIYYRLPRETRGYLPAFIAATYAMNYFEEHKITPVAINFPIITDTVLISRDMHMEQISAVLNIPLADIRALNPQYRAKIIPGKSMPMAVTLPLKYTGEFIDLQDSISNYKAEVYFNPKMKNASPGSSKYIPPNISGKAKLIYTVKEGDNLGYIASWYSVGLSDLRYWNNIYRNLIRVGQKLAIYVEPSKKDYYASVSGLSFEAKQNRVGKPAVISAKTASTSVTDPNYVYHTVRYGDTVWDIAKKYTGVSTSDILYLNGMGKSGKIKVGQKLKIKKKS